MNYRHRCKQPPWLIKTLLRVEPQRVDSHSETLQTAHWIYAHREIQSLSGNLRSLSGKSPRQLMMKWWNWQWNQAASGRLSCVDGPGLMSHKSAGTLILECVKWLIHCLTLLLINCMCNAITNIITGAQPSTFYRETGDLKHLRSLCRNLNTSGERSSPHHLVKTLGLQCLLVLLNGAW